MIYLLISLWILGALITTTSISIISGENDFFAVSFTLSISAAIWPFLVIVMLFSKLIQLFIKQIQK